MEDRNISWSVEGNPDSWSVSSSGRSVNLRWPWLKRLVVRVLRRLGYKVVEL